MSYNSKYTGAEVESYLDQIASGEIGGGSDEVYVGTSEPTDDSIEIWIDESTESDDSGNTLIIDTEMSDTSTNAVQNMVIKSYVDDQIGNINTILETIIAG